MKEKQVNNAEFHDFIMGAVENVQLCSSHKKVDVEKAFYTVEPT